LNSNRIVDFLLNFYERSKVDNSFFRSKEFYYKFFVRLSYSENIFKQYSRVICCLRQILESKLKCKRPE